MSDSDPVAEAALFPYDPDYCPFCGEYTAGELCAWCEEDHFEVTADAE